jgi:hypothetical protein
MLLSPLASADIYKCPAEKRAVKYQNFPCNIDSIGSSATESEPGKSSLPQGFGKIDMNDPKALAELREWRLRSRPDRPTGKLVFETTDGESPAKGDDLYTRFQAAHESERLRKTEPVNESVIDSK